MATKFPFVSRDAYERLAADNQALQDRLRSYQSQNDYLRAELDAARADATQGREMVCDWLALQVLGRKIFGTAPDLPMEMPDREAIEKMAEAIPTARSMAKRQYNKFNEDFNRKVAEIRSQSATANGDGRTTDNR